jgi:hypothetical protein
MTGGATMNRMELLERLVKAEESLHKENAHGHGMRILGQLITELGTEEEAHRNAGGTIRGLTANVE